MNGCDEPDDRAQEEERLPPSSAVTFLHAVGQSTVRQGITVPVIAQVGWLSRIPKGWRDSSDNQSDYNKEINSVLSSMGWRCETRILSEIGLRCDFEKNGIWVEVEFGNARVYYQDYIKFLLALRHRAARLGILLCPTNAFAQLLCDLGQRRARIRTDDNSKRRPSYSGMMSYEKAIRELPFIEFILNGSIVIAGIEIQSR